MRPLVIAHRGASWEAPENTLPAFELAIAQGADYIEFDVRRSGDGELVVAHDRVRGPRPASVHTLDEVLAVLAGRIGLAIEIKEEGATEGTLAALAAHAIASEAVLMLSFRVRTVEKIRRRRPDLRTVLNLGRRPDPAAASGFWGVGVDDGTVRPRIVARARSLGLATTVFTVNDPARMRELADLGVTGIFTDRPAVLREALVHLCG